MASGRRHHYWAKSANVGLKLTAGEVARGILARDREDWHNGRSPIVYGVLDPSAFAEDGGEGAYFSKADNRRVGRLGAMGGWDQVRARLKGDLDGNPMLFVFSNCHDTIRTFPMMQHDPDRPEDMMTDSDDHCVDDVRYSCMSRPFIRPAPNPASPEIDLRGPTLAELVKLTIRNRDRSERI